MIEATIKAVSTKEYAGLKTGGKVVLYPEDIMSVITDLWAEEQPLFANNVLLSRTPPLSKLTLPVGVVRHFRHIRLIRLLPIGLRGGG